MDKRGPLLLLGSCPKCRGDLALERDTWGEEYVCLQCGRGEATPPTPVASLSPEGDENGAGKRLVLPEADVLTRGDRVGHR
jgi:uncharacterized protein YbaR (Trm112 family)